MKNPRSSGLTVVLNGRPKDCNFPVQVAGTKLFLM